MIIKTVVSPIEKQGEKVIETIGTKKKVMFLGLCIYTKVILSPKSPHEGDYYYYPEI